MALNAVTHIPRNMVKRKLSKCQNEGIEWIRHWQRVTSVHSREKFRHASNATRVHRVLSTEDQDIMSRYDPTTLAWAQRVSTRALSCGAPAQTRIVNTTAQVYDLIDSVGVMCGKREREQASARSLGRCYIIVASVRMSWDLA